MQKEFPRFLKARRRPSKRGDLAAALCGAVAEALESRRMLAGISGSVFADSNGNGVRDAGEGVFAGAAVSLQQGSSVIAVAAVDAAGNYAFSGLAAGNYEVAVRVPRGFTFGPKDMGGDDLLDSDVAATGTAAVSLALSDSTAVIDAGASGADPLYGFVAPVFATNIANHADRVFSDSAGNPCALFSVSTAALVPTDYDPGPGVREFTGQGYVLARYTPRGALISAFPIQAHRNSEVAVAVDAAGNVFVAGQFTGPYDVDPGPGLFTLTSSGQIDGYVARFSPTGAVDFAQRLGSIGFDMFTALQLDASGNLVLAGNFDATVDFDLGAATALRTSSGGGDAFFMKTDPLGNLIWVKTITGPSSAFVSHLSLDAQNNILLGGNFNGTADFDPDAGTLSLTGSAMFIAKYDSSGAVGFARAIPTISATLRGLSGDSAGNVIAVGTFGGTIDFDPGPGVTNLVSAGSNDGFILKLQPNGDLAWASKIGGTGSDAFYGVTAAAGAIYIAGEFTGTVDMDPGVNAMARTSAGNTDAVLLCLRDDGSLSSAFTAGATSFDQFTSVAVSAGGVLVGGWYRGTIDLDPSPRTAQITSSDAVAIDGFLLHLRMGRLDADAFHDRDGTNTRTPLDAPATNQTVLIFDPVDGIVGNANDVSIGTIARAVTGPDGRVSLLGLPMYLYYARYQRAGYTGFAARDIGGDETLDSDADPVTGNTHIFELTAAAPAAISAGVYQAPSAAFFPVTPNARLVPLDTATFTFNRVVSGVDLADLKLSRAGGPNLLIGAESLSSIDGMTWTLSGLAPLNITPGAYQLTLTGTGAGITDARGAAWTQSTSVSWAVELAPAVSIPPILTPTAHAVDLIPIAFNKPVTGLTLANLSLTRNGGPNLLTAAQRVSSEDNITWYINGRLHELTALPGDYQLTLTPAGITDMSGNPLQAGASRAWTVIPPSATIGGRAFIDANANGIRDTGEAPGAYTAVELWSLGPDGFGVNADDVMLGRTVAGADGKYSFNVSPDGHYLRFRPPAGFHQFSPRDQGGDDTLDSDANELGTSGAVYITAGQAHLTCDAGLIGGPPPDLYAAITTGHAFLSDLLIAPDQSIYICGSIDTATEFDPGPATVLMTSSVVNNGYVAKYSPAGAFLWLARFGAGVGRLAVDSSGNLIATGAFNSSSSAADLDPSPGKIPQAVAGGFLNMLDPDGRLIYSRQFGGAFGSASFGMSGLVVDPNDNVFLTGSYKGSVDADPGPASYPLPTTINDNYNSYLLKLNSAGEFAWASTYTHQLSQDLVYDPVNQRLVMSNVEGNIRTVSLAGVQIWQRTIDGLTRSLGLDAQGNIYVGGDFSRVIADITGNFADFFVAKYTAGGDRLWVRGGGGPQTDNIRSIDVDAAGNVYAAGTLSAIGDVDLDMGPGVFLAGPAYSFALKLNTDGAFQWAIPFGFAGQVFAIKVDSAGRLHVAGTAYGDGDFLPGAREYRQPYSGANSSPFFAMYDANPAKFSGSAWLDLNRDGVRDGGEPPQAGATVSLYDAMDGIIGNGNDVKAFGDQVTAADGSYQFFAPFGGDYYLKFTPTIDTTLTLADVGANDTLDSDANPAHGRTTMLGFSPGASFTADVGLVDAPARVLSHSFDFQSTIKSFFITFSEDISATLSLADFEVTNFTTSTLVPAAALTYTWDPAAKRATISFTARIPADGIYGYTLRAAGVTDTAGNLLDGNTDGVPGGDYAADGWFLNADANRDRVVNHLDYTIVYFNFGGTSRTFAQGDFTGDGRVDFSDFQQLELAFGRTMPPPAPAKPVAAEPPSKAPFSARPIARRTPISAPRRR